MVRSDRIDMVGKKYGHLTVLAEVGLRRYRTSTPRRVVIVQCDCGAKYVVRAETVRRGAGNSRAVNACQSCAATYTWLRRKLARRDRAA